MEGIGLVTRIEVKVHEDEQTYNLTKKRENNPMNLQKMSLVGMGNGGVTCLERRAKAPCGGKTSGCVPTRALKAQDRARWANPLQCQRLRVELWEDGWTGRLEPSVGGL